MLCSARMNLRWLILVAPFLLISSGCATEKKVTLTDQKQTQLERLEVGKTTKAEVESQLGMETGAHVSSVSDRTKESWGYAYSQVGARPGRYIPFLGVFAVGEVDDFDDASFAVSFSEDGTVSGMTQRKLSLYYPDLDRPGRPEAVTPFGGRNLNAPSMTRSPPTY